MLGDVYNWRVLWFAHKTYRFLGQVRTIIPVPAELMTEKLKKQMEALPLSSRQEEEVRAVLKEHGVRKHSLRRSGAKWWESKKLTLDEIQKITLHSSQATLIHYLEDN